jgi:integrase
MLFEKRHWGGLADGTITLAFRRWKRPAARAGARHVTPAGVIEIDEVRVVDPAAITAEEAAAAGFGDLARLQARLARHEGEVYRVAFHLAGPDPRAALRADDGLDADAIAGLAKRLDRMDARGAAGPWTRATLALIAEHPGVRAGDLATLAGRERDDFKVDVRKLKALGLTESLPVGYRLSPRGRAFLLNGG